jgi:hypothetical protein
LCVKALIKRFVFLKLMPSIFSNFLNDAKSIR